MAAEGRPLRRRSLPRSIAAAEQVLDRPGEPVERETEHGEHAADDLCRAVPGRFGFRIEPDRSREVTGERHEPSDTARAVLVRPRPRAVARGQLPWGHERIADDDELPGAIAFAEQIDDAGAAQERGGFVDAAIDAIVEVAGAQLLEVRRALRRREEPLT